MPQTLIPESLEGYYKIKTKLEKGNILICERDKLSFTQNELLEQLSDFSFYLALPGRGMPLCHNLTEALFLESINYYTNFLSEKALVNRVLKSTYEDFYLQAEGYSIVLYKKQLEKLAKSK